MSGSKGKKTADSRLQRSEVETHPDVVFRRLGEDTVLVHMATNSIYELNHTAGRLWDLLGQGCTRKEIQDRMLMEFDVSEEELTNEIEQILTDLWDKGLVTGKT